MSDGGVDDPRRVIVSVRDGVADIRLNRPDKLNALDPAMFAALATVAAKVGDEPGLRAVVLSGEGSAFSAGLDMQTFAGLLSGEGGPVRDLAARAHRPANLFQDVALAWRQLPVPVIAAISGPAFGGGLQVALGADIRIAAPDAKLSLMEIRWGVVPDMGGTVLLRELLRDDVLRELTYTGRVVSGEEAAGLGLVTRLAGEPREAALALAREIAGRSPDAIRAAKRLLNVADDALAARRLRAESAEQASLLGRPNQREAVRANLERRQPVFAEATRGAIP